VLSGGDDPLTSPACSRRLANHFHAVLKVHPTAGHELALDSPDWFADSIAEWLETIEPPTRAGA
jgi:pimeloyl-ACP methyl ester carboxylesterase